jgi:hypothetical protein
VQLNFEHPRIREDKIVGFHDATRLTALRNSAMPGPLTP